MSENFFYSNLFIAIVTFVVGSFGVYLYYRRRRDEKRRIAKIILLEIENAQIQLKDAKQQVLGKPDDPLPEHLYVMPTDTWNQNKHLFIKNFKPTQWNAINQFYDLCHVFDEAIKHNDARFGEQEKELRKNVHKATYSYTMKYSERIREASTEDERERIINEFFKKRNSAVKMLTSSEYVFIYTPAKQNQIVNNCLTNIDVNLSLGSVGQRFEKLSKNRFFF